MDLLGNTFFKNQIHICHFSYRMLATQVEQAAAPAHIEQVEDRVNIDSSLMDKTEQFRASLRGQQMRQG